MTYYTMRQAGDVLDCLDIAPGQSRRLGVYQKVGRPLPDALLAAGAVGAHEAKQAAERGSLRETHSVESRDCLSLTRKSVGLWESFQHPLEFPNT